MNGNRSITQAIWPNMQQIVLVNSSVYIFIIDDRWWLCAENGEQVAGSFSSSRLPLRYSIHIFRMVNGSCYHFYLIHILVMHENFTSYRLYSMRYGYETSIFIKLKKKKKIKKYWNFSWLTNTHIYTKNIPYFLHLFIVWTQKWSHFRKYFQFTKFDFIHIIIRFSHWILPSHKGTSKGTNLIALIHTVSIISIFVIRLPTSFY